MHFVKEPIVQSFTGLKLQLNNEQSFTLKAAIYLRFLTVWQIFIS